MSGEPETVTMWKLIAGAVALTGAIACGFVGSHYSKRIADMREAVNALEPVPRPSILRAAPSQVGPDYFVGDFGCDAADCEEHLRGWRWAAQNRAWREDDCGGSGSDAFLTGCLLYIQATGRASH